MNTSDRFAEGLQRLERERDPDGLLGLFADEIELLRPEPGSREQGLAGARRFWQAYLDQFQEVRSEFMRVEESGQLGVLVWVSRGQLIDGRDIAQIRVALLVIEDAKIRRVTTYYDTAAFTAPL